MPLPGTPHVARFGILFTFGTEGNQCENILHVRDVSDGMFSDPVLACNLVQAAANTNLLPALASQVALTGVVFEDVRSFPFGGMEIGQAPHPGTGSSAGSALPSSVSIAIKKSTAGLGRSARGRWYWPVAAGSNLAGSDTVTAGLIAAATSALADFCTQIETTIAGSECGVVSYRSGGVQRAAGLFQPIVAWSVSDAIVDSQRRRLAGRGR